MTVKDQRWLAALSLSSLFQSLRQFSMNVICKEVLYEAVAAGSRRPMVFLVIAATCANRTAKASNFLSMRSDSALPYFSAFCVMQILFAKFLKKVNSRYLRILPTECSVTSYKTHLVLPLLNNCYTSSTILPSTSYHLSLSHYRLTLH